MLRLIGKVIGLFCVFLVVGAALLTGYGLHILKSPNQLSEPKLVMVVRGAGVGGIADQLLYEQIIPNRWVFIGSAVVSGAYKHIKAGEYEFQPGMTTSAVLTKLSRGETYKRKVTIREGLTSHQIVVLLNQAEKMTGEITEVPAEGSLLPETYHYIAGDSRSGMLARMEKQMQTTLAEVWPGRAADLPIKSPEEAVVLASIVEKETGVAEERRRVAGVFINRLKQGMKLQTDPTVIYALTQGKPEDAGQGPLGRRLLRKDLEQTDSPYNTYLYPGLPPGPIANPGRDSLEAVLHPEVHDYLFFVADGKGGHVFARTAREHERNVAIWRKERAAEK